jgi:hypothetical protein
VVDVLVGSAGGVPGLTVVVAAVVVVVVVAISVEDDCCSWRIVAKLTRYWSGDGDRRYRARVEVSSFGGVGGLLIFLEVTSVRVCVGSLSLLDSGDFGLGRAGSSSEYSTVTSRSDGRLSPSYSWMSGLAIPRYGLFELVSWSSSCQRSSYRVTALAFWFVDAGGLNSRTSYPRLFLGSSADTNVIRSLEACAECGLLRAMCVSSNQTRILLVSLELAMVEKE